MTAKFSFSKKINKLQRPHIKLVVYIIFLLVISGVLSLVLYDVSPAWSALFTSISAGCVTGIIFYLLVNIRNNELRDVKEEFEEAEKHRQISKKVIHMCLECIENNDLYTAHIPQIIDDFEELALYLSTLLYDCPRTIKLIKDFNKDFVEKYKETQVSISLLKDFSSSNECLYDNISIKHDLLQIISFCMQTENMLFEPMLELMKESCELDRSIL